MSAPRIHETSWRADAHATYIAYCILISLYSAVRDPIVCPEKKNRFRAAHVTPVLGVWLWPAVFVVSSYLHRDVDSSIRTDKIKSMGWRGFRPWGGLTAREASYMEMLLSGSPDRSMVSRFLDEHRDCSITSAGTDGTRAFSSPRNGYTSAASPSR